MFFVVGVLGQKNDGRIGSKSDGRNKLEVVIDFGSRPALFRQRPTVSGTDPHTLSSRFVFLVGISHTLYQLSH